MKASKIGIVILALVVANFYALYYFSQVIDKFADEAAALVIQDTFAANNAVDISKLRQLKALIEQNKLVEAKTIIEDSIDGKLYQLELCLTDVCNEYKSSVR